MSQFPPGPETNRPDSPGGAVDAPTAGAPEPPTAPLVDTPHLEITDEPYGLFARLGAEAFGTFALVLAGVGVALYAAVGGLGGLGTALAFGAAAIAGTAVLGHVSGGHLNPAVTFGAALAGRLPWSSVLPYWLAQLVGGALATAVLFIATADLEALEGNERAFFSGAANGFGEHSPIAAQTGGTGFGLLGALVIEVAATAVFATIVLASTNARVPRGLAPVAGGVTYAAMILVALPVTNGSLNPARSTAAAIFAEPWAIEQLWVFWVGPLIGALIAGTVAYVLVAPRVTVVDLEEEPYLEEEGDREPGVGEAAARSEAARGPGEHADGEGARAQERDVDRP